VRVQDDFGRWFSIDSFFCLVEYTKNN
jgi:hypothetical protein